MEILNNFFSTYGIKVLLSFIPLTFVVVGLIVSKGKSIKDEQKIKKRTMNLGGTIAEKNVLKFIKKDTIKNTAFSKFNAQMRLLGIESKFENLSLLALGLFFVGAIGANLLIGAGILLMLYFGVMAVATIYVVLMNKMDSRRKEIREEFIEKIVDVASNMSVGISFQNAIGETLKAPNTSFVMARELERIRDGIYSGEKYSDEFMKMYHRLNIKEIKEFAQMCFVYEETGGQFSNVIYSFQDSYKMKRKIQQENEVFESSMKNDEKIIVGVPVVCIIGFSIFMPEVIRGFYSSFFGQMMGIVLFSVIYAGTLLMSRFIRSGGES